MAFDRIGQRDGLIAGEQHKCDSISWDGRRTRYDRLRGERIAAISMSRTSHRREKRGTVIANPSTFGRCRHHLSYAKRHDSVVSYYLNTVHIISYISYISYHTYHIIPPSFICDLAAQISHTTTYSQNNITGLTKRCQQRLHQWWRQRR